MNDRSSPLYLLPGYLSTSRVWQDVASRLEEKGILDHQVQILEVPNSSSIEETATGLLATLPDRFGLVGHSMGGYIALEAYAKAPERFTMLGLCNTSPFADSEPVRQFRNGMIASLKNGDGDRICLNLIESMLQHVQDREEDAGAFRTIMVNMAKDISMEQLANNQLAILERNDHSETVKNIACPCLVVSSGQDKTVPPKASRYMSEAIANACLLELPECGHMAPLEAPGAIADALARMAGRTADEAL